MIKDKYNKVDITKNKLQKHLGYTDSRAFPSDTGNKPRQDGGSGGSVSDGSEQQSA